MEIPENEAQMTAGWLAETLNLDPSAIAAVNAAGQSENRGLFGAIAFIEIDRAGDAESPVPDRLVCNYVPPDPVTGAAVREYEVFAREANFYRTFAAHLDIRVPRCYAAHYDPEAGAGFLLLEDCSHMDSRNLADEMPSAIDELRTVVDTTARLCRSSWDQRWLRDDSLIMKPGQHVWEGYFGNQQNNWQAYLSHELRAFEADGFGAVAERLSETYVDLLRSSWPQDRFSLAHMDFHAGNYFVDPTTPEDPIVVFDWQAQLLGRTAQDLSGILTASYPADFRRQFEDELIRQFHDALGEEIQASYSFDDCWSDYEHGILITLRLLPMFATELDTTSEYGAAVGQKVVRNLSSAVMDLGGVDFLERMAARNR